MPRPVEQSHSRHDPSVSAWQPTRVAQRYHAIDALRGLALFGVLMVNLLTAFRVPLLQHIFGSVADAPAMDRIAGRLVAVTLEFKAFTIFSFLFGAGVAMQLARIRVFARMFLVRGFAWLFLFGIVHLVLIWNGDILALYAVCGMLLLPFLGLSWPALFALGAVAILAPEFVSLGPQLPSGDAAVFWIAQARQIYRNSGFIDILRFRWRELWAVIMPLLIAVQPRTTGLMLWGMAVWRSGVLRHPQAHRPKLAVACAAGFALWGFALKSSTNISSIGLALAYVSVFLLWSTTRPSFLPGIAAAGRMALTNYITQSIIFGLLFYGYGFGLFGQMGVAVAACIGVVVYAAQVQLSRVWLMRFQLGPLEWLWRSLAYGRRQPILGPPAVVRAGAGGSV